MKLNEKGFSVVEILIIIVVLSLTGFVGWRAYNSSQNTKDVSQETAQQSEQTSVEAGKQPNNSEMAEAANLTTYINGQNLFQFYYPGSWVTLTTTNDGTTAFLSEERIEDETVTNAPLSKNIYLFFSAGVDERPGAGIRYAAGENASKLIEPLPEVFKTVTLASGEEAFIYKQLTSSVGTPAEIYFLADKDMNNLRLSNGKYLWFNAQFNGMQGDYAIVAPLKEEGTFNPDERQEIADFASVAESLEIN